ncbi:zinc finger SWIM domain-containing protein 3 [Podarcis raffonei]|uniref:zinc finger SWIM domain-containing protein 3 n=1 Tax=Podarcis raffonei TaxID=65483 RepID=UPI00232923E9|nr:zinc finger SWIM domain-containing protein 3 [Podarcis raffonei]
MELGSCFKNYEDFRECFSTYKKENRLQYGLRSCVSIRFHNRKNGTNIREDVTFMQVKFGCSRSRDSGKKRKQQASLCPAYFVLQYNEEIDRLVISELNGNHVHTESKASLVSSNAPPGTRMATKLPGPPKAPGSPPAKLRREEPAEVEACERDSDVSVEVEVDSDEPSLLPPSPRKEAEVPPQAGEDGSSSSAFLQVAEVMKNFLRVDMGSLASISVGSDQDLERLNFQTSKMRSLFVKFPESLLLHRVQSKKGHILYAFLVESKERVGKLVHLAILKEDTQENTRKMFSVFKEFNPEWQKVKVVFMDMSFLHRASLQELFPSAQVLLSVYHTVRLLEKKLKESHASFSFKYNFKLALKDAVFSTSTSNLDALSQQVRHVVDQDLYKYLRTNWFSCEMLWYMHAKKGLHSCSTYIDSLDFVAQKLSQLFGTQPSLETSILRFVEYADSFNTKGLENLTQGLAEDSRSGLMQELKVLARPAVRRSSSTASQQQQQPLPGNAAEEPPKQFTKYSPAKPLATMLSALRDSCTDVAYQLCLNEWDVVQKSVQLLSCARFKTTVQLLEDTHQVSRDGKSCSCYFHCRYQLPCRHILSMLLANGEVVGEAMVGKRWQKEYQHLSVLGENLLEFTEPSAGPLGAVGAASGERGDKIQSLSKELGNLLLQSEGEELEERTSTLKMIVNIWTKCCELQGGEGPEKKPLNVRNVGDLPFLWVKKEEMEEVEVASGMPSPAAEDVQTSLA